MTNRTVVILTEPARCELADAEMLVQAVLEVQQLNKAGLSASHAFCDHPAAAMQFIEAYAKAYPELHLRSSDLPPPEDLYSIVADGRLIPLPAPGALDSAKAGDASQLQPLYVLSLGAPDALMRALQHNRFARSDIQVLEIAPPDTSKSESVSVAEAVAPEPLAPFRRSETSPEPELDQQESYPSEELASSDPLRIATIEVDLDHSQPDRSGHHQDRYDLGLDKPATSIAATPQAPAPAGDWRGGTAADSGLPSSAESASDSGPLSAASLAPGGTSSSTPTTVTTPPISGAEDNPELVAVDLSEDSAAVDSGGASPDSSDATGAPSADGPEESPEQESERGNVPEDSAAPAEGTDAGPPAPETAVSDEDPARAGAVPTNDPGEDIRYPPTGSFSLDDDLTYPLPLESRQDGGDTFDAMLLGSGDSEAVDLEAVIGRLFDSVAASSAPDDDLGLRLLVGDVSPMKGCDLVPEPDTSSLPPASAPDHEDPEQQRTPAMHDLDI
jgi:hypothetical protein